MGCENECLGSVLGCVGGSLHNLFVVSGAPGAGEGGGGARQETKSDEKKGRQTVDKEELVTSEGGDIGVGVTVLSMCKNQRHQKGVAPADLLKLRQMGTLGVHMKGVLPWLVR